MKRYTIEEYKFFEKVTLYTVHLDSKKASETDEFIKRFFEKGKYSKDFQTITYYLNKIGEKGALERYFRFEWKAKSYTYNFI